MKSLFRVYTAGRVLLGTFGNKHLAMKAMRQYNAKRKPQERPAWVSHGPDHWRAGKDNTVPRRPKEVVWTKDKDGEPVKLFQNPETFWNVAVW